MAGVAALIAAIRTCFAWRLIVLVETPSRPRGVGAQICCAFRLLRPDHMIARTLVLVIMQAVEAIILVTVEKRLLGWMRQDTGRRCPR